MDQKVRPTLAIVGAGRTGRGFLARLAARWPYEIVLVDRNHDLVRRLREDGGYTIHFFDKSREPFRVTDVTAFTPDDPEAIRALANAEIIFTAVGEQNLRSLVPLLNQALECGRGRKPFIVTGENGVAPADALSALRGAYVSEAAIFCSTVEAADSHLDIRSESYDELPFDAARLPGFPALPGMVATPDFHKLLRQKIYTYNCLSACIAYLGAFKGHHIYADAANDPEITEILWRVLDPLNFAVSRDLAVGETEQRKFAQRAVAKFSDHNIEDDIPRNARGVARKLRPNDRLIGPLRMIQKYGGDVTGLILAIAAALHYDGPDESEWRGKLRARGVVGTFAELAELSVEDEVTRRVAVAFHALEESRDFAEAMSALEGSWKAKQ